MGFFKNILARIERLEEYYRYLYANGGGSGGGGGTGFWGTIAGSLSNQTDLKNALDSKASVTHTHTFSSLTSKPTTVDGYGISDVYTRSEADIRYSMTDTTYLTSTITQMNTGTDTTPRVHTPKVLNDWLDAKGFVTTDTNTTYTSSNGISLAGTNFTPEYGTAVNTIAQGNDARILNGQTAFTWGNHSLAGYQPLLVSGTTIKTVNGVPILGSGDIIINSGNPNWGSIGGTLTDQTDLINALGEKANTTHTHTFSSLTSKPTTIAGYGITDFNSLGDDRWSSTSHNHAGVYEPVFTKNTAFNKPFGTTVNTVAQGNHTHTFSSLTSRPTTVSGYGITDFNSLGDARWSSIVHTHTFGSITGKPTTLAGYGITDGNTIAWGAISGDITSQSDLNTALGTKSNTNHTHTYASLNGKPTTLAGFAITDAYTKSESDVRYSQTDTTYLTSTLIQMNEGTDTVPRVHTAKVLNDWLEAKGYSTQTLTQGANISIVGGVINALYEGGVIYYVSNGGDDTNDGLSPLSPFATIDKVNSLTLVEGDTIKFRKGDTFTGKLIIEDNGSLYKAITFTSYSTGLNPIITTTDPDNCVVLSNCSYITLMDIDVSASVDTYGGIKLEGTAAVTENMKGIKLIDVNVYGFRRHGLYAESTSLVYGLHDLLVLRGEYHNNGTGIYIIPPNEVSDPARTHNNIQIRYVKAYMNEGDFTRTTNHSGSGIVIGGALNSSIEYCEAFGNGGKNGNTIGGGGFGIWLYECTDSHIRYCESHHNRNGVNNGDGGGFDLDGGCQNCVIEACYSHHNDGAGYGMFQYQDAGPFFNNHIRYNISVNDARKGDSGAGGYGALTMWAGSTVTATDNSFHNNTVYVSGQGQRGVRGWAVHHIGWGQTFPMKIVNNIFYVRDSNSGTRNGVFTSAFANNLWYVANGATGVTTGGTIGDPIFKNPGWSDTVGLGNFPISTKLFAYELENNSPAKNTAIAVSGSSPTRDFAGFEFIGTADRGALEAESVLTSGYVKAMISDKFIAAGKTINDVLLGDGSTATKASLITTAVILTGNQTIAGVKTFSSSPVVPTPTTDFQVATKKYVDDKNTIKETRVNDTISFWTGTQAQYDAITTKSVSTLYYII